MSRFADSGKITSTLRALAIRLTAVLVVVGLLGAAYVLVIRPGQLRWGATDEELARPMPEDGIVANPAFNATRAITIHAQPQDIWPWLLQIGYQRAGFYGYDLIENIGSDKGIRSAPTILPALQHPHTGDPLPISAVAALAFGSIEPGRYLVWRGTEVPPSGVFIWALVPVDASHTRLISRIRWRYLPDFPGNALGLFTEFGDHVAVRAILRGVRDRVEGRTPESLIAQAADIAGWLVGMLELAIGVVFILASRRWIRACLLTLFAGLLLQFVLYGPLPVWASAPLPWLYLAVMAWNWKQERTLPPHQDGGCR